MKKWIKIEEVIKLMKENWELGYSQGSGRGMNGRYWLQKNGLCKGGDSIDVNGNTINKLKKENLIEYEPKRVDDSFWLTRYRLK
jgi:hypothetical protein